MPNKTVAEVPTTGRTPAFLAKRYGFPSLDALINDIPKKTTVLDIGAGMSLFGHAVAARRPDITWINIDPYYKNALAQTAIIDAPSNVRYMSDDLTQSAASLKNIHAARIYCYWVLPHLSLVDDAPAAKLAGVMWDALAPGGVLMIGPDKPYHLSSALRAARYMRLTKEETDRTKAVASIIATTRLPQWMRLVQDFVNRRLRPVVRPAMTLLVSTQMKRARQKITRP